MRFLILVLLAIAPLALVACGDDDDAATSTPTRAGATGTATGDAGTIVAVELLDFSVLADPASGPDGDIEFQVSNTGPSVHEFVLVKTDDDADSLPTEADGSVSEGDLDVIQEVEDLAVGATQTLQATLDSGHYALFCNIVDDSGAEPIVHYKQGMHTDFTVE